MPPIGGLTAISDSGPSDLVIKSQALALGRSIWAAANLSFVAPRSSYATATVYPPTAAQGTHVRLGPLISHRGSVLCGSFMAAGIGVGGRGAWASGSQSPLTSALSNPHLLFLPQSSPSPLHLHEPPPPLILSLLFSVELRTPHLLVEIVEPRSAAASPLEQKHAM
jgi:hypothetical protein